MTDLTFGTRIEDSISIGGEQDTYTFDGLTGDQLCLRLSPTNSFPVDPVISILRPDGTTLIEEGRSIFIRG